MHIRFVFVFYVCECVVFFGCKQRQVNIDPEQVRLGGKEMTNQAKEATHIRIYVHGMHCD